MAPLLSIAIPFHGDVGYLRIAIESVLQQDCDEWRLLVCDDTGSEEAAALVAGFGDPRIVYESNALGEGMVANWNRCLDRTEGDLVTLLHGDDRLLPGYVRLLGDLGVRHPDAVALFCAARVIDARGAQRFSLAEAVKARLAPRGGEEFALHGEPGLSALMRGNFVMCPTLCFRRSLLRDRRFSPEWQQVQDLELTTRLLMEGETLVGSRRVAYAYRRHGESASESNARSLLRHQEEFELCDRIAEQAAQRGWPRAARLARAKVMARLYALHRALAEMLRARPGSALAHLRFLAGGGRPQPG